MQLLILAGGRKKSELCTEETPKPLIEIHGKPIIEYQIDFFKRHGIKDITLCTGYKCELFEERYPDLNQCAEKKELGTAGAIKNVENQIKEDFIVTNGDNIFFFNFQKMHKTFQDVKNPLMALTKLVSPYGVIDVQGSRIVQFREKPVLGLWINAGITLFTLDSLDYFPKEGMIEYDVYPKLAKDKKLFAFKMRDSSFWVDIDTEKDIEAAKKMLLNR